MAIDVMHKRAMQVWAQALVGIGCAGLLIFCSLRESPHLSELQWMPTSLGQWIDSHGVGRNVVAFGLVALALSAGRRSTRQIFAWCLGLAVLAATLEVAQLWLPRRVFDWKDIAAGWAGIAVAGSIVYWSRSLVRGSDREDGGMSS